MEQLRVEVSGDSKDLQKAVQRATKELKTFEKAANTSVGGLEKPINSTSQSFGKLKNATANANPTLQEFSRVIQDAPFGIQGVGNNITQLVSNFGNLSKSAGGSRNAIKLLLSSFAGPGGILFVISAVVSLLTVYGDKLFRNQSETQKLAEATKEANEELENYVETLGNADKAFIRGQQSAQSEIVTLGQLRDVVEDTARSTEDRAKAIQELRRLFPSYFQDLSDEEILTGNLSGVYDQLTESIIKRARATAATNILVSNAEQEIAVTSRLLEITQKLTANQEEQQRLAALAAQNARSGGVAGGFASVGVGFDTSSLESEAVELREQLERIAGDTLNLTDIINENGGIDLSKVEINEGNANGRLGNFNVEVTATPNLNFTAFADTAQTIEDAIVAPLLTIPDKIDIAAAQMQIALNSLNEGITNTLQGGLSNTLFSLGDELGNALAQGGNVVDALGNALLQSIGSILSQLGQQAIALGVGLLGIRAALKTLNPAAAIAAGVALVALGSAVSSRASGLGNSIGGSGTGGANNISSGGNSSSASFTSSSGGFEGNVVFEIAGQKLIGVLERTRSRNLAIGG